MKFGNLNIPPKKKKSAEGPKDFEGKVGDPTPEPIVMVNPVLSRQAGLKERKPGGKRKSISEGGDMYVPKVFSEPEPWQMKAETPEAAGVATPAEEAEALKRVAELEAVAETSVEEVAPETHRERRQVLKRSVEELTSTIASRRAELKELMEEAESKPGVRETDRFAAFELERDEQGRVTGRKQNELPPNVHARIASAESDLIAAEKELYAKQHPELEMMRQAANDNFAEVAAPTATVAEGSNVLSFPEATLAEWEVRKASREGNGALEAFDKKSAPAEAKIAEEESSVPFIGGKLLDSVYGRREQAKKNQKGRKNFFLAGLAALGLVTAQPDDLAAAGNTHDYRALTAATSPQHPETRTSATRSTAKPERIEIYSTPESATGEGHMSPASIEAERTRESVFARAHPGERAHQLFARLKAELHALYPKAEDAPDAVTRQILSQTPDQMARALHFENAQGEAIMHGGYSLELAHNGQLVFYSPGRSTILMESTPESKEYPHGVHVVDTFHGRLTPREHHAAHPTPHSSHHRGAHPIESRAAVAGRAASDREAEGALDQRELQAYEIEHPNGEVAPRGLPGDRAGFDAVLRDIRARRAAARNNPPPISVPRPRTEAAPAAPVPAAPEVQPSAPPQQAPEAPPQPAAPEQPAALAQPPAAPEQPAARPEAAPATVQIRPEHHVRPNGQTVEILWAVGGTYEERLQKADEYVLRNRGATVLFDASPDTAPGTIVWGYHSSPEGVVYPLTTVIDPDTNQPIAVPRTEAFGAARE